MRGELTSFHKNVIRLRFSATKFGDHISFSMDGFGSVMKSAVVVVELVQLRIDLRFIVRWCISVTHEVNFWFASAAEKLVPFQ